MNGIRVTPTPKFKRSEIEDLGLSPAKLSNREYVARKHILSIMRPVVVRSIGETEMRIKQSNIDFDGFSPYSAMNYTIPRPVFQVFNVDANYHEVTKDVLGEIKCEEVMLPFEYCKFILNYIHEGACIYLHQDKTTKKISVVDEYGTPMVAEPVSAQTPPSAIDVPTIARANLSRFVENTINPGTVVDNGSMAYLQHALAVCVLLDTNIVESSEVLNDLGQASKSVYRGSIYKLLPLRVPKNTAKTHNINTGKKTVRLHVRRGHWVNRYDKTFWRRWTIVGDIFAGVVFKTYKV